MSPRRGLANRAAGLTVTLGLTAADRALQLAPIGFDVLAEEVYPYLLGGGSVALPDGAAPVPPDELWRPGAPTRATPPSTPPAPPVARARPPPPRGTGRPRPGLFGSAAPPGPGPPVARP